MLRAVPADMMEEYLEMHAHSSAQGDELHARGALLTFTQFWHPVVVETLTALSLWTNAGLCRARAPAVQVFLPSAAQISAEVLRAASYLREQRYARGVRIRAIFVSAHLLVVAELRRHLDTSRSTYVCTACLADYLGALATFSLRPEYAALRWFDPLTWGVAQGSGASAYRTLARLTTRELACPNQRRCYAILSRRIDQLRAGEAADDENLEVLFSPIEVTTTALSLPQTLVRQGLPALLVFILGVVIGPSKNPWTLLPPPIMADPRGSGSTSGPGSIRSLEGQIVAAMSAPATKNPGASQRTFPAPQPHIKDLPTAHGRSTAPATPADVGTADFPQPRGDADLIPGGGGRAASFRPVPGGGDADFVPGSAGTPGSTTRPGRGGDADLVPGGAGIGDPSGRPGGTAGGTRPSSLESMSVPARHDLVGTVLSRMGSKETCRVSLADGTYVINKRSVAIFGPFERDEAARQARVGRILSAAMEACKE